MCCNKFMRYNRLVIFALIIAAAFTSCVTDSDRPHVRVGMSRDDLSLYFGRPSRIEPAGSGREDWYYSFVSWSAPQIDGTASRDAFDPTSSTVSVSASSTRTAQECPIHLSADGHVIEPIPGGKIVGR